MTAPFPIKAEGRFLVWLEATGLLHVWDGADRLPEPRQDFYRREMIRLFVREQRTASRRMRAVR